MNDIINHDGGTPNLNELFKWFCNAIAQLNLQNGDDLKTLSEATKIILSSDKYSSDEKLEAFNKLNDKYSEVCAYRADAQKQLSEIIKNIATTVGVVAIVGIAVAGTVQICNGRTEAEELRDGLFD